jgi:tetratricopeptide (TPR) repeat protein
MARTTTSLPGPWTTSPTWRGERATRSGREASLGPDHLFVAGSLAHLGRLAFRSGDNERALLLLERRLTIVDEALGTEGPWSSWARADVARVLLRTGDRERADRLYQGSKTGAEKAGRMGGLSAPRHLYEMGCLAARLGKAEEALGWLGQALDLGFDSPELLTEPDLASLRGHDEFRSLVQSLRARGAAGPTTRT